MNVAVVQMNSVDSREVNLDWIQNLVRSQHLRDLDLICFPENCLYMRVKEGETIQMKSLEWDGFKALSLLAKEMNSNLHLGSVSMQIDGSSYNSSVFVGRDGHIRNSYQKIHLFDIDLEGRPPIRESDLFDHGRRDQVLDVGQWKIGQSICYDLRFAELYSRYAKAAVDLILVPSAFIVPTGKAHWEILIRARAIENQCFLLASCQAGTHQSVRHAEQQRQTYGHSMIVGPWGDVIAELPEGTGVLRATLDQEQLQKVRTQMPMRNHRQLI